MENQQQNSFKESPVMDKVKVNYSQTVGEVLDDGKLELERSGQKQEEKNQKFTSKLKDTIQEGSHTLGDGIEKVGRKLQDKGFEKVGSVIEKAGDKVEHMAD